MKRVLWLIIPLVAFFGCEREPVGIEEDRAAIESLIGASAYLESEEHYGDEDTTDQKGEIDCIFWWRGRPTSIVRNISIDIVGDSAFAEINTAIDCSLHIIALDSIVDTIRYTTRYAKLFTDHGKRYAIFKRDTVPDHHRGWRLYALSGVDVESQPNTVQIDSMKIEWGDSVRIITDILRIETREEVLTVSPGQLIDVSVWTNDTTALVFLHFRRERRHRKRFHYSEGRFHRTFLAPAAGVRHIAVGAMTHSTLYDSVEPYDSNTWLTVYRIE